MRITLIGALAVAAIAAGVVLLIYAANRQRGADDAGRAS